MKILYVVSNIKSGGPLKVVESLILNLNQENEIELLSIFGNKDDNKLIKYYEDNGVKVMSLGLDNRSLFFIGKNKMKKFLAISKPDIIHSHGIHSDYILDFPKKEISVSTIHCNFYEDYEKRFGKLLSKFIANFQLHTLKRMNKNICCSESVYLSLKGKLKNSCFIRNGVTINKYDNNAIKEKIRSKLKIPFDSVVYVYCGVFIKRKGVLELINLFNNNHNDNEYLILIGDGPEYIECQNKAKKNIIFVGFQKNPEEYYIASDIYVSNSASEGLSISVLEALSLNNKLLLSDIPSHNECVNLSSDIYLGDIFDKNNFREKMNIVESKIGTDISEINYIISDVNMANKYQKMYKDILD